MASIAKLVKSNILKTSNISTISTKFTALVRNFMLISLILVLGGCPVLISAGWQDRLLTAWERATTTRTGQVAVVGLALAACYGIYKFSSELSARIAADKAVAVNQALISAAQTGDHAAVAAAIAQGANVVGKHTDEFTVLYHVVQSSNLDAIRHVLAGISAAPGGSDVSVASAATPALRDLINLYDSAGKTALIYAVSLGNLDLVSNLLAQGADARLAAKDGFTPLMCAAQVAHSSVNVSAIAELLITNIHATDSTIQAVYVNQRATAGYLLNTTAVNIILLAASTFSAARQAEIKSFIKVLLKYGLNLDASFNRQPLADHAVIQAAQAEIVRDSGANESKAAAPAAHVNTPEENLKLYFSLIMHSTDDATTLANNYQQVDALFSSKQVTDVNLYDTTGYTGLCWAAENCDVNMVKCLLRHQADVSLLTHTASGHTPLMHMVTNCSDSCPLENKQAIIKLLAEAERALLLHDGIVVGDAKIDASAQDLKVIALIKEYQLQDQQAALLKAFVKNKGIRDIPLVHFAPVR